MITVEKAREKLWPEYDKLSDEQIESLIFNYSKLARIAVDMAREEYDKENYAKD